MLSIIVPVMNEEGSLKQLWEEIVPVAEQAVDRFEVIFIDDGSTDQSWQIISELIDADSRINGIRFRRNFGKAAALTAGMRAADGDLILMMDADLQDDPATSLLRCSSILPSLAVDCGSDRLRLTIRPS